MITKDASRRLRGMPNNAERTIIGKIDALAADLFAPNNNVVALKATDGFRLRVGGWPGLPAPRGTMTTTHRSQTMDQI